ncbi:hypothetical protein JCM15519_06580 [Fundidesulfovibrio butyratiphilus]
MAVLLVAGCWRDPLEQGVVARVNGSPIPQTDLEFLQAQAPAAPAGDLNGVLAALGDRYGQALAQLVVQELVAQDLKRRGMALTEADLRAVEATARQGYPGRAFEDTLAEEGLDYQLWRRQLKSRADLDRFAARVLRPRVSVSAEEVRQYYKDHAQEFSQAARVTFLCVESKHAQSLRAALDAALASRDPADMLRAFDDVSVQAQTAPEEKLPPNWKDVLGKLSPGQASAVRSGGLGFQAFILLERVGAKVDGLVRAYPLVEKRLIEGKMERAFAGWLEDSLSVARIEINPALEPKKPGS